MNNFRQFANHWINDNVSKVVGRGILYDVAELLNNYNPPVTVLKFVLFYLTELVTAWEAEQKS